MGLRHGQALLARAAAKGYVAVAFCLLCTVAGLSAPFPVRAGVQLSGFGVTPSGPGSQPPQGAPQSVAPILAATPAADSVSDGVGATVAKFRVDEGGNATYSIPIQIPPGTAGVAPKLGLTYNSRLPNGAMGPGWAIEGSSQLGRCRQARENGDFMSGTTPVDGNPAPVNFTTSDRFCLDGVRLLLTSTGTYGGNGTTYSPENDPTILVTATLADATKLTPGPISFRVQRKDGTTSTYGNTSASPNALITATLPGATTATNISWNLSRFQDSVGNYIDYLYTTQPSGSTFPFGAGAVEYVLSQVNFTGHATTPVKPTYASVTFNYTTLGIGQVRMGYQAGVAFLQSQQLSSVSVNSGSTTMRYYALSYQNAISGSGVQQLSQVQECHDSSCAVHFPPTLFTWSAANLAFVNDTTQTPSGPNFTTLVGYKVADVDGDGRQDFVFALNDGACGSNSSIYVGFLDQTPTQQMTLKTLGQAPVCATINLSGNDQAWSLVDYDGDGMADLLIGGASASNWKVYRSLGRPSSGVQAFDTTNDLLSTGLRKVTTPIAAPSCYIDFTGTQVCPNAAAILADLNGDGLPDLLYPNPTSTTGSGAVLVRLMVRQSDGTFKFSDPYTVTLAASDGLDLSISNTDTTCDAVTVDFCNFNFFQNDPAHHPSIAADVNGDGRSDITLLITAVGTIGNAPTAVINPKPVIFDPKAASTTTVGRTRKSYWYQFAANGYAATGGIPANGGRLTLSVYARIPTNGDAGGSLPGVVSALYVADLNGDGLADLLYQDPTDSTGQTYHAMLNTGAGYQAPITVTGITNGSSLQLADITGDGKVDLVYLNTGNSYSYVRVVPSTTAPTGWAFSAATAAPAGLHSSAGWLAMLSDFDGDGAPDFLAVNTTSSSNNLYTSRIAGGSSCPATTNSSNCSRYHARDVITAFSNGYGATTTVTYLPLTNIGVYERGSENSSGNNLPSLTTNAAFGWNSPVFDVLAPMYVVSQASSSAPTKGNPGAQSTVSYRYAGALMQAGGRGFLGFYETWSFDANDASAIGDARSGSYYVVTQNSYFQNYPFIGMPETTVKLAFTGTTIDRGTATLNACAANTEGASNTCFALAPAWPDLISTGIALSFGGESPYCNGVGCAAVPAALTNYCTSGVSGTTPSSLSSNIFSPQSTPGPVFSYADATTDTQYDPSDVAGRAGAVSTASTNGYYCYDGNGTTASHGNLTKSATLTVQGSSTTAMATKLVANTYSDDATKWFLGRLTQSTVTFKRPSTPDIARTTNYTYDPTTGLLLSERIQKNGSADQDIRTVYTLDAYGNRTGAYQCSSDITTDSACTSTTSFVQQQSGTQVHRYAKTTYDSSGRYTTGSALPFYSVGGSGHLNEQPAVSITARDEFGNATGQSSINGLMQSTEVGVMGRPYFASDNTGKASTTTYRTCGSGTNRVGCSSDAMFTFRSQTVTVGAPSSWTYFDVLGRPVLKLAQSFDNNPTGQLFSGVCSYYDAHTRGLYQSEPFFLNVAANASDGNAPTLPATVASPCASESYATTTKYDLVGRVVQITQPDSSTIKKSYVGLTTFTTNPLNKSWEETKDALGEVTETRDPSVTGDPTVGLIVDHTYDAAGDVLTTLRDALNNGGGSSSATAIITSFTYDVLGRKSRQTDPDSGTTLFSYNAAGDAISQTDAKNQTITQNFDALGRHWQRTTTAGSDGNILNDNWTFDTATNGYGQLSGEVRTSTSGVTFSRSYLYDIFGRSSERDTSIAGNAYTEVTAYDAYSRLMSQQDASGYTLTTDYTGRGYLNDLTDSRVGTLYQVLGMTSRGQVSSEKRGNSTALQSTLGYDPPTGRISTICSGTNCGLQDLAYQFDFAGNLSQRKRAASTLPTIEVFTNDALSRLTLAKLTQVQGVVQGTPIVTASLSYDLLGDVCTKNGAAYSYAGVAGCLNHGSSGSPHAATVMGSTSYQYDLDGNQTTSNSGRTLVYNALNQLATATTGSTSTAFQYSPDGDRFLRTDGSPVVWPTDCKADNTPNDRIFCNGFDASSTGGAKTTYYVGNVEIIKTGGTTEQRRYLGGVAIDYVRTSGSSTSYLFADHLGSTDVVASSSGVLIEAMSFDVHGNRRDPNTWQGGALVPVSTTHGFTGHEHVDSLNFIHMNGRVYDPQIGRMLEAEPMADGSPQGWNRYSYVVNNPLALTDPTGYSWWSDALKIVVSAVIIYFAPYLTPYLTGTFGAYAGYAAYAIAGFAAGVVQTGTMQGGLIGAFTAAFGYGITQKFGSNFWAATTARATEGGVVSSLQGGNFGNGFFSAGVTAGLAPSIDKLDKASRKNNLIKLRVCVLKRDAGCIHYRTDRVEVPITGIGAG